MTQPITPEQAAANTRTARNIQNPRVVARIFEEIERSSRAGDSFVDVCPEDYTDRDWIVSQIKQAGQGYRVRLGSCSCRFGSYRVDWDLLPPAPHDPKFGSYPIGSDCVSAGGSGGGRPAPLPAAPGRRSKPSPTKTPSGGFPPSTLEENIQIAEENQKAGIHPYPIQRRLAWPWAVLLAGSASAGFFVFLIWVTHWLFYLRSQA